MQKRLLSLSNVEILWNTEAVELLGEFSLEGVVIRNNVTGEQRTLQVTGFFVAIGHQPNTAVFKDFLTLDSHGYIQTEPGSTRTNIEGVFACGDAQDNVYRQAITAAGTGCMAALDAERFLAEKETQLLDQV